MNVATRTLAGLLLLLCLQPAFGQDKPPVETKSDPTKELKVPAVFEKDGPDSVKDLQEMQAHTRKVLDKVLPCTVGVRVGGASGSGVIIDKEGHVLTAGHVSGKAGQQVTLILPDGKMLKGETLGANRTIDSGMIKITDKYEGGVRNPSAMAAIIRTRSLPDPNRNYSVQPPGAREKCHTSRGRG